LSEKKNVISIRSKPFVTNSLQCSDNFANLLSDFSKYFFKKISDFNLFLVFFYFILRFQYFFEIKKRFKRSNEPLNRFL